MTAGAKLVLACMLALAAAGCKNREAAKGGNAVSKVLPGSASDAMIAYDTLRSQSPLAPATEGSEPSRERSAGPADTGATVKPTAEPSAAASGSAPQPSGAPPVPRSVPPTGAVP